jgi:hypothetical protein
MPMATRSVEKRKLKSIKAPQKTEGKSTQATGSRGGRIGGKNHNGDARIFTRAVSQGQIILAV